MIEASRNRWIRGVAALEPTYVRNDEAAVALTWLAASPEDVPIPVAGDLRLLLTVRRREVGFEVVLDGDELRATAANQIAPWSAD